MRSSKQVPKSDRKTNEVTRNGVTYKIVSVPKFTAAQERQVREVRSWERKSSPATERAD